MNDEILAIDDDLFLLDSLKQLLETQGFSVRTAHSAQQGLVAIVEKPPKLLILDLSLPDEDGVSLCRKIRGKWKFPIIMLTSRTDLMDKVIGLEVGADDYLTKPFEGRELVARVRANLRRQEEYTVEETRKECIEIGPLKINLKSRLVEIRDQKVTLTSLEFRLIHYFVVNAGRVLEREKLFETVWGYEEAFNSNSLDVFVYRLRSKLEKASGVKLIHTIRGFGYRFGIDD
jgi:two-component system, OmpR family, response regulator VicR